MSYEPTRILSPSSEASAALKSLMRASKDDGPSADQIDHLEKRLNVAIAAGVPLSVGAGLKAAAAAKATSAWTGWVAVAAVSASLSGGAVYIATAKPPPPPIARHIESPPALILEPPSPPPLVLAPEPAPPRVHHRAPPPHEEAPNFTETDLLARALDALRGGDAARALDVAALHERLFREGALAQERDAIAIEAMLKLGQKSQALERLGRFEARYPHSGYGWRFQALLAQ